MILNSTVSTSLCAGDNVSAAYPFAESAMLARTPCVEEAVLLAQLRRMGEIYVDLTGTLQPPFPLQEFFPAHPASPDLQPP